MKWLGWQSAFFSCFKGKKIDKKKKKKTRERGKEKNEDAKYYCSKALKPLSISLSKLQILFIKRYTLTMYSMCLGIERAKKYITVHR